MGRIDPVPPLATPFPSPSRRRRRRVRGTTTPVRPAGAPAVSRAAASPGGHRDFRQSAGWRFSTAPLSPPAIAVGTRTVKRIDREGVVLRDAAGRDVFVAIRTRKPPPGGP